MKAILGILHLTTHRLTFHASLMSTRPDLLPDKQIIKAGPVTVHRPGLMPKRRLWVELSHDMFTVFPSAKAEDRIRPIRTMLRRLLCLACRSHLTQHISPVSSIQRVLPEDPERLTVVRCEPIENLGLKPRYAEFDTVESARDWRREMQGEVSRNISDAHAYI